MTKNSANASTVARLIDRSQFDLRRASLPEETCRTLSVGWAETLTREGVLESEVEEVFRTAMGLKADNFPLTLPEVLKAARVVIQQRPAPSIGGNRLDATDIAFYREWIPVWASQNTAQSREYLAELQGYFAGFARTKDELAILEQLNLAVVKQ